MFPALHSAKWLRVCLSLMAFAAPFSTVNAEYVDKPVCEVCTCTAEGSAKNEHTVTCLDGLPEPARWASNSWRDASMKYTFINIFQDTLEKLEKDAFKGLDKVDRFTFRAKNMKTMEAGAFNGLSVKEMQFTSNAKLAALPKGSFDGLVIGGFGGISIESNAFITIEAEAFSGLISKTLFISSNMNLVKIEKNAFKGSGQLGELQILSNPKLTTFEAFAFNGLTVTSISIYTNGLATMAGAFNGCVVLNGISIFQNKLKVIETETFKGVSVSGSL